MVFCRQKLSSFSPVLPHCHSYTGLSVLTEMAARIENPCGSCLREVSDRHQGIQCETTGGCGRWFHRDCVKISKAEYEKLSANTSLKWECLRDDCDDRNKKDISTLVSQVSGLATLLSELSSKMDTLLDLPKKIDVLDSKLNSFEERIACTEKRLGALETVKPSHGIKPEDILSEINDRTRRASNIMIYNLVESTNKDSKVRKSHDDHLTTKIFEATCPGLISYKFPTARVGKATPNKPRPLKVMLKGQSDALEILRNFSSDHLKTVDDMLHHVKVSRDRTPQEIKHLNDLRDQLKSRQDKGEKDITIRYLNGIPSIVKTIPKNV